MMDELWKTFSLSYEKEAAPAASGRQQNSLTSPRAATAVAKTMPATEPTIQQQTLARVSPPPSSVSSTQSSPSPEAPATAAATIPKQYSKAAIAGALEVTRQRRRYRAITANISPTSPTSSTASSVGSDDKCRDGSQNDDFVAQLLRPPDLEASRDNMRRTMPQESRNDQERPFLPLSSRHRQQNYVSLNQGSDARSLLQISHHPAGEMEVTIGYSHAVNDTGHPSVEKSVEGARLANTMVLATSTAETLPPHADLQPSLSPKSLNERADEIILEAQLACTPAANSRDLIQEALDKAATKVKAAAAEAIASKAKAAAVGAALNLHSSELRNGVSDGPKLRTTQEVLRMANGVLNQASDTPTNFTSFPESQVPEQLDISDNGSPVVTYPNTTQAEEPPPNQCLSPTLSDMGSIDDYEKAVERLPTRLEESEKLTRAKILQIVDGIVTSPVRPLLRNGTNISPLPSASIDSESDFSHDDAGSEVKAVTDETIKAVGGRRPEAVKSIGHNVTDQTKSSKQEKDDYLGGFNLLGYFWGSQDAADTDEAEVKADPPSKARETSRIMPTQKELPAVATSLVRVMSDPDAPGYGEAVNAKEVDPRMPKWIDNQFTVQSPLPPDGSYHLGSSRTVIVHEIQRGSWTWCTAWSPDGSLLAVATENHHLAVIDTKSSSVWRVRHDKRIKGPVRNGTTHSVRAIAWGARFIAIGGTGNAVSILAPTEPYPILHIIQNTGFVGSLHWLKGTNTLAIGSRLGKALIVNIWARDDEDGSISDSPLHSATKSRDIQSTIVHTIDRQKAWVNCVKFSPGGTALAVGDGEGLLGIYTYTDKPNTPVTFTNVANFKLEDSVLDVEWSADGQWLYAGGEDFAITVINTKWWEAVHRIRRDRWVQFISGSMGGTHIAVGGVSSEVSLLDVDKGWDTTINVSLKGLVPLSASWHPRDQYLVLTGQNNSILAVETTNARYVSGHYLRSVSPVLNIEFSPDGRRAVVGNEAGIVTIFKLTGTTFVSDYELVLDCKGSLSMRWSLNGSILCIACGDKLVVVKQTKPVPSAPPNRSSFSVARVVRDLGTVHCVAIHPQSRLVAVCGSSVRILDAAAGFQCVKEYRVTGATMAASWSPDGNWLATTGKDQNFVIQDTSSQNLNNWKVVFTVKTKTTGLALAWGPANVGGLQYCAYGGEGRQVHIMEIRTKERTWENVLSIDRDGIIHELGWNKEGLLAAAIGNGTVTVMDLSYLQSGWAVNEMDYNWQRQALTCFTEIRRNRGKNCMRTVRWIPAAPGSDCLLAVGGTDGDIEILDLTERQRCSGFCAVDPSI